MEQHQSTKDPPQTKAGTTTRGPNPFGSIKRPELLLIREQEGDFVLRPAAVYLFLRKSRIHAYSRHVNTRESAAHLNSLSLLATGISARYRDHQWWSGSRCTLWGFCSPSTRIRKPLNHTTAVLFLQVQSHSSQDYQPPTQSLLIDSIGMISSRICSKPRQDSCIFVPFFVV